MGIAIPPMIVLIGTIVPRISRQDGFIICRVGPRRLISSLQREFKRLTRFQQDFPLTVLQRRIKDDVEWVSSQAARYFERSVTYPVHHLDFETFMPAIPVYPNTRGPIDQFPFSGRTTSSSKDGTVHHDSYLVYRFEGPSRRGRP